MKKRKLRPKPCAPAKPAAGDVKSVRRAMSILNAVAAENVGIALTQLARTISLPPSTAHRLLVTLQSERYVVFNNETQRWSIGLQAFEVAKSYQEHAPIAPRNNAKR